MENRSFRKAGQEASVTKKVDSIEGTYGYGYQLWMEERPGSFEYNGMLGQNVLIYPDVDMVIVTNAGNEELFQDNVMLKYYKKIFPGRLDAKRDPSGESNCVCKAAGTDGKAGWKKTKE